MKNLIYASAITLSVILFTGCSNDDSVGSGNATLKITAGITNLSSTGKQSTSKMNENLSFTTGYVWVSEIVFDGTLTTGSLISRSVTRFSKIDFATGVSTPSLDDITIPVGDYTYVNLGVELRDEDAQPSVLLEGTYTRTDSSVSPIRFEFNSGEVFEAETSQQVSVTENEAVLSKIVFDPNVWFSVVPTAALDNATVNGEGIIVISGTSNTPIFDLVADRLDVSTESVFQ